MEKEQTFKMSYSAEQQEEIQNIRKKYVAPEENKMEQLCMLDARATKKAISVSLAVGISGALIMGAGMSVVMTEEMMEALGSAALPVGMMAGIVGIIGIILAYPLYIRCLKKERKKIAPEIIRLTDELMQ